MHFDFRQNFENCLIIGRVISFPKIIPFKIIIFTYQASLIFGSSVFSIFQRLHDLHLHFRIIMLISVFFMSDSFLGNLLVIHGILSLVD